MSAVIERLDAPQRSPGEDRGAIAKMVMKLLTRWSLTTEDQAAMLGLAVTNRATLSRYRNGEAIGSSRDQYERVGHLLGIHKNLRLLFPQNRDLVYGWMRTRNHAFNNLTPVDVIREQGFVGLLMVRSYLDRARGVCAMELSRIQLIDTHQDLIRNIVSVRVSQDLFDQNARQTPSFRTGKDSAAVRRGLEVRAPMRSSIQNCIKIQHGIIANSPSSVQV
jgi:hypothetical protein